MKFEIVCSQLSHKAIAIAPIPENFPEDLINSSSTTQICGLKIIFCSDLAALHLSWILKRLSSLDITVGEDPFSLLYILDDLPGRACGSLELGAPLIKSLTSDDEGFLFVQKMLLSPLYQWDRPCCLHLPEKLLPMRLSCSNLHCPQLYP
ncbi:hypothetical protein DSO57_1037068 [Entomophthora muscae]|uniref:Uncharacterized protein n=1 Tax=Entomophthora muscae TaxID=34485 RepID=A0ACC2SN80_9FUNG|nr:hypothetical protein DSO57_1037068 [Entomophthora muscae]